METTGRAKIICSIILIFLLGAGIWHTKTVMEDRGKNEDVQFPASEARQGLVFAVKEIVTRPIMLRNAYVTLTETGQAEVFFSGTDMVIPYSSKYQVQGLEDIGELSDMKDHDRPSGIADVTLIAFRIEDIVFKEEYTTTKVTEISEQNIHLKEMGTYEIDENFKIYNVYGKIFEEPSPNVLLGYNEVSFVIEDEKLQAAIIREGLATKNIRVLLSDNEGYYHSYVEFTSDTDFSVNYGNRIVVYEADEIVTIHTDHEDAGADITVAPNQPTGTVTIMSMNKSGNIPSYRGSIEVSLKEQGFVLINELPVEEYLFAVVSSEMPSTYDMEALKVQAICARGYAYSRINQKMYSAYGAHVDDTTACQVYNNVPETERTIYAVKDTFGMVPVYDGEIIEAFYFSTSDGTTCSNDEVWGGKKEGYLNSGLETPEGGTPSFSDEEDFRYFINHGQEYDTFEKDLPFYRWKIFYTYEDMTNAVNSVLAGRMSDDLKCFAIMTEDGSFQPVDTPMESIGEIEDITVTKRGDSGIILEMVLTGSDATIRVTGQTNVRYLFSPEEVIITKQDGTENSGWTSLPSPFYYIEKDDTAGGFLIAGGGFGHGVGMSQNGANEMAKHGYSCEEIMKHYYQDITIEKIIS